MATPAKELLNDYLNETKVSEFIPYTHFVDQYTMETKSGLLMQVVSLSGLYADTLEEQTVWQEKDLRNTVLKSIADPSIGVYVHMIRREVDCQLSDKYKQSFIKKMHDKWQRNQQEKHYFINEWYISLFKKPPQGKFNSVLSSLKKISTKLNSEAREKFKKEQLNELNQASEKIVSSFRHYQAKRIGWPELIARR